MAPKKPVIRRHYMSGCKLASNAAYHMTCCLADIIAEGGNADHNIMALDDPEEPGGVILYLNKQNVLQVNRAGIPHALADISFTNHIDLEPRAMPCPVQRRARYPRPF